MTRTKICSHFFRSCNLLFIFFGWCCCCYWFPIHTYIITSPPSSFRTQWILHSTVKRTCCAVSVWVGECWMVRLYFFSFLFSFVCARAKKTEMKNSAELCRKKPGANAHNNQKNANWIFCVRIVMIWNFFSHHFYLISWRTCACPSLPLFLSENIEIIRIFRYNISERGSKKNIVKILLSSYLYYDVQKVNRIIFSFDRNGCKQNSNILIRKEQKYDFFPGRFRMS